MDLIFERNYFSMSALLMKKCDIHRVSKFEGFKVFFEGVKLVYFQFTYDGSAEQCTMVGRHIIFIILYTTQHFASFYRQHGLALRNGGNSK